MTDFIQLGMDWHALFTTSNTTHHLLQSSGEDGDECDDESFFLQLHIRYCAHTHSSSHQSDS